MAKKGYGGGMPGMNMNQLMKQAQKMQQRMEEAQEELGDRILEITSGGGAVKVAINGKKELQSIIIAPDVVDPEDVEMLQDLILTAVNEAVRSADEMCQNEMNKITGGLGGLI